MRRLAAIAAASLLFIPAAASAQVPDIEGYEPGLEGQTETFGATMEAFAAEVEAIEADDSLSEEARGARIAAAWAEVAPEVQAFSAAAARFGSVMASRMVANMDFTALTENAMAEASAELAALDTAAIEAEIAAALAEMDVEAEVAAALAEVDMAEVMAATAHAMAQAHAELQAARLQGDVAVD